MRSGGTACTSLGEEKPAPWQPTIHSTVKVHQWLMCRDVLERGGGLEPKALCTKNSPNQYLLPTRSKFPFFQTFLNFWSNAPKCRHLGGGGMCMLFEICEKTPFQKCMGKGGGWVTIFLSTEAELFGVSGFSGLRLLRSHVGDTNS